MRDAARLRRWLHAAALVGACGGSAERPAGPTARRNDAGVVADNRTGVMRTPPENCTRGQWCGPVERVRRFAPLAELDLGCPEEASDTDGTSFRLRREDTAAARAEGDKGTCCYDFEARCYDDRAIEGRPYLDGGVARTAPVEYLDDVVAAAWLSDALAEHASVASFARHALELMALAAPASLVADVLRAAQDELGHADGAFALASRFAGRRLCAGPLPALPPRPLDLDGLAASVLVEGCWNESAAALGARRARRGCRDPQIRAHLGRVSRDEARHAALAWRTLAWAVEQGARLPAFTPRLAPVSGALDRRMAEAGQLCAPELAAARADAWRAIVRPLLLEVGA